MTYESRVKGSAAMSIASHSYEPGAMTASSRRIAAFVSVSSSKLTVSGAFSSGNCTAGPSPVGLIHIDVISTYTAVTPSTGASISDTLSVELCVAGGVPPPSPLPPEHPTSAVMATATALRLNNVSWLIP
jgi:hypothetical protein